MCIFLGAGEDEEILPSWCAGYSSSLTLPLYLKMSEILVSDYRFFQPCGFHGLERDADNLTVGHIYPDICVK